MMTPNAAFRRILELKAGGEMSETQWRDLRGILIVSGARLDREYLRLWHHVSE
jgi:hypothetical protein